MKFIGKTFSLKQFWLIESELCWLVFALCNFGYCSMSTDVAVISCHFLSACGGRKPSICHL